MDDLSITGNQEPITDLAIKGDKESLIKLRECINRAIYGVIGYGAIDDGPLLIEIIKVGDE